MKKGLSTYCMLMMSVVLLLPTKTFVFTPSPDLVVKIKQLNAVHAQHNQNIPEVKEFIDLMRTKKELNAKISHAQNKYERESLQAQINTILDRIDVIKRTLHQKQQQSPHNEKIRTIQREITTIAPKK